ncbi:MAG: hypothetical protein C0485_12020 [Pirellula sp.]|nr:hypothetical protein [Pirellula sp.]
MKSRRNGWIRGVLSLLGAAWLSSSAGAVSLNYAGSQANLDNGYYSGGELPYTTSYWRSDDDHNIYAASTESPNRYYGTAGYALFATTFSYPDANVIGGNAYLNPDGSNPLYPNLIDLPEWVSSSQPLATRMAGGWGFSLIDDPVLQHGIRHWTFDGVNYPDAGSGAPNTGQNPYVKMGYLDGTDIFGNDPNLAPTGRWAFTVGANAPEAFRIGVITGGSDSENFVPAQVYLQQYQGTTPVGTPLGTGLLADTLKDRFVDMHFFDIIGAQEGDTFAIGAMAGPNSFGNAGVAGFSFDVLTNVTADDADFDGNGTVDGADFLIWQRGSGATGGLNQGDANNDGNVNAADLEIWKTQFGTGAAIGAIGAVPEPAAVMLLAIGICGIARFRK